MSPLGDDYDFDDGYLQNKISNGPPPLIGAQNNIINIVSQSQKEKPNLEEDSGKSDDNNRTQPCSVSKSDVRLLSAAYTSTCSHRPYFARSRLYYWSIRFHATLQQHKVSCWIVGCDRRCFIPCLSFSDKLSVLLFDLKAGIVINNKCRRDRKEFTTIILKDPEFKSKFNDLSGCIANVSGIKWKTFGTTKCYAFSFYEIIK